MWPENFVLILLSYALKFSLCLTYARICFFNSSLFVRSLHVLFQLARRSKLLMETSGLPLVLCKLLQIKYSVGKCQSSTIIGFIRHSLFLPSRCQYAYIRKSSFCYFCACTCCCYTILAGLEWICISKHFTLTNFSIFAKKVFIRNWKRN